MNKRSCCPIACTLDLLGDKWTLLVVRDMLLGRQTFKEFAAAPEKIATNILSDRLNRLVASGLAEKTPLPDQPNRDAYRLTDKGKSLRKLIKSVSDWGLKNLPETEIRMKPIKKRRGS
ncbi:MAG: helix-turn-helix domain-containing protein [Planctomycetota bacterium]